jgi:hypothetical protein
MGHPLGPAGTIRRHRADHLRRRRLLLTHGPLAVLSAAPSNKLIKELAEFTLALVLFSDASRVRLHELRADAALYLRLLGVALPLTIGPGPCWHSPSPATPAFGSRCWSVRHWHQPTPHLARA